MDATGRLRAPWIEDGGGWAALGAVLYALVLTLVARLDPGAVPPGDAWLLPAMLAAAHAGRRAAQQFELPPARKQAWRLVSVAILVAAASLAVSLVLGVLGQPAAAAVAGAVRLAFYPLVALACVRLMMSAANGAQWARVGLDGVVVTLSFGALLWLLVLRPAVEGLDLGPRSLTPATAYPMLDAGLFLLAVLTLTVQRLRDLAPACAWLAVGLLLMLAGDTWRADLSTAGEAVDTMPPMLLLVAAHALLAVAAQADRVGGSQLESADAAATRTTDLGMLPFLGLALAMAVLVYHQAGALMEPQGALVLVVCVAGIMMLLRQRLTTREVAGQEASLARRAAEDRFSSLVRNSSDVIAIAGHDARLFYLTPSAERVFGARAEDLLGQGFADLFLPEDRGKVRELLTRTMAAPGASADLELRVPRGGEHFRVVHIVATNLADEPTVAGCVLNIRDITDRKRLEDQLTRLAFHDPLTLLANRALFRDRVEHAIAGSRRRGNQVAAIFVDLDNFKKINDSLGHGEGDRVLRATAQRLSKCTRTADTVARLGGDEFAVLVEDAASNEAVVETAARIVEALKEPFAFSGSSLRVAASVGVAFAGPEDGVEELLRNADVAMYHAKAQGKSRYSVFQPRMQEAVRERLRIEADLARAIGRNELRLHFQPIVDLESGYLLGVEALVRWQHPTRGLIPPAEFINVAEESGQVIGLGRWVLYEACSQVREWQGRMPMGELLRVAVNVSGQQLQGDDLVAEVKGALEHSGLDAGCLVIEMTESVVMHDTEATFAKLKDLKRLGIRIAIDDFGTGYSSLSYLHRFPIDILKIDRSFVERLGLEKDGTELARAIVTLGETLGLEVVAEGIEYEHQVRQLMDLGCVAGQGFYYSRPALLREIEYSHQAKLRKDLARELPPEATVSATGRFQRPRFEDFQLDLEPTGSLGR